MAYRVYKEYRKLMAQPGGFDISDQCEAILCRTGNNCLTQDPATTAGFTLNECDGSGYARKDVYLDVQASGSNVYAYSKNAALDTLVTRITQTALGAGSSNNVGVLFASKSTHPDHPSVPIIYIELTVPGNGNGEDFHVDIGSGTPDGILIDYQNLGS